MTSRSDFIRATFTEAWSRGESAFLEDGIGEVVFHYGGQQRQMNGRELRAVIEAWRTGFPDLTFTIEDLLEQGERIAVRAHLRGTHEGPWRGLLATGREFGIDVMMFFRFEQEQLVEIWEVDDALHRGPPVPRHARRRESRCPQGPVKVARRMVVNRIDMWNHDLT